MCQKDRENPRSRLTLITRQNENRGKRPQRRNRVALATDVRQLFVLGTYMSRDEILQLALSTAKDEYLRGQSRLGLVETKSQLISATVGILLALIVAVKPEDIPHSDAGHVMLLIGSVGSLVVSLILSIAASLLVDVRPPQNATETCKKCEELIREPGDVDNAVDAAAAERLVGDMCASYLAATKDVTTLLADRLKKLRVAQIALLVGILLMLMLIALPYLGAGIRILNTGV